ncbi:hypothetical protein [Pantoea sp. MBLJ3]|jgi:hypothetical protein|uniref:hypothetical protein n=1 Tax=Pantoea sp. MBLJ3 TaxID=1562889 RepID=UPI00057DDEE3|nr:hypothetical protein [Pantoea sp. MBLJ3]
MLKAKKYYVAFHYESGTLLHRESCHLLPKSPESRIFIGTLYTSQQAMTVAVVHHKNTERCPVCLQKQNPEKTDAREEQFANLSNKPVAEQAKRPAPTVKKAPAIAARKCESDKMPAVKPAAAIMKLAIAEQQPGPQQVVKIKSGLKAVAVQHFVYDWPN